MALDEDQPQVSDVVDRTVQGRKGPPGLFGGGRLTVLRRLGRGRRGGRLRFVDVDADQYGPARLAGRSSCRAKSRDQNRQRADNPFRGNSGRNFPPRENWSVGRVHLTSSPWVSPKACLHSKVLPANGNRSSRNSVTGRQRPATPCNAGEPPASVLPHRIALGAERTLSKGFFAVKTRFIVTRIADRRQTVGHPSPHGWLNVGGLSGCCSAAPRR